MRNRIPNIIRQEDIYRLILELNNKLDDTLNQPMVEDKLITITQIKEMTGINYSYWMDMINKGLLHARFFNREGRVRGGFRVWKSKLIEFINSPLFDPPMQSEHIQTESTEEMAKRIIREMNSK